MVSQRCKLLVKEELKKLGIDFMVVDLGVIETFENISTMQLEILREKLKSAGLELLDDKRVILVESIKKELIEFIQNENEDSKLKYSDFISEKFGYEYTYLANLFSEVEKMTIQQFMIVNKIERVKELILFDKLLSFNEIAYQMRYSSPAHLSNQFKRITGQTPSYYKEIAFKKSLNTENV